METSEAGIDLIKRSEELNFQPLPGSSADDHKIAPDAGRLVQHNVADASPAPSHYLQFDEKRQQLILNRLESYIQFEKARWALRLRQASLSFYAAFALQVIGNSLLIVGIMLMMIGWMNSGIVSAVSGIVCRQMREGLVAITKDANDRLDRL